MSELPELETIKNSLILHCLNRKIKSACAHIDKFCYPLDKMLTQKITNQCINNISRRVKHLLIHLNHHT